MKTTTKQPALRVFARIGGLVHATFFLLFSPLWCGAETAPATNAVSLFDGQTLKGWMDVENNASTFSGGDITDLPALVTKLSGGSDAVSVFLRSRLDDAAKTALAAFSPTNTNTKQLKSALAKGLNNIVSGPLLYDDGRFQNVRLRPETAAFRQKNPSGLEVAHLNKLLIEDAFPTELARSASVGWIVKDGAMASTGAGRGVLYSANDYNHYRLTFTMRHVSGKPDHQACVLIFCARPREGEKPLDALGGIQFQVPNGGSWDYRPGHNNAGKGEFARQEHPKFDPHEWSRIELLVDAATGTARMAIGQPVGNKAVEVLDFHVPDAGKTGPIAWQMHNGGLFDDYKDVAIEVNPASDDLITTK